nr:AmmeMemoRadiSam system radical SAM enzyme [Desulfogranum mediterraneum]
MLYSQKKGTPQVVVCGLCNHRCTIPPGRRGICGVRENRDGTLVSLVYGKVVAEHVDPIEKKPLFHFLPGSRSYSLATMGCNFRCLHCQNFDIAQAPQLGDGTISGQPRTPEEIVARARAEACASISYTYVEPTIFYEFSRDCAELARRAGLANVYVSNGYMSPEAAREIASWLDAINIDIKAFTDDFYKKVCRARLQPVLDNVRLFHQLGVWVEVTTLIIPGLNDSDAELKGIARFLYDLDPAIPWHVSAFRPAYRMTDRPPTSAEQLARAHRIGVESGLHHVYQGNIPGEGEDTICPSCGGTVLARYGFMLKGQAPAKGQCPHCAAVLAGVWE